MANQELPIPSDVGLNKVRLAAQRAMTPARPLPKIPFWHRAALIADIAGLGALCVWLCLRFDSTFYVCGLIAALVGTAWILAYRRRCPDCRRRLKPFKENIYGGSRYRELFRCSVCEQSWDSGGVGDDEVDKSSPG
jgi:hypothetical protein